MLSFSSGSWAEPFQRFRAAVAFFTCLPVGRSPLPESFAGVVLWIPGIGILVGGLAGLSIALLAALGSSPLIAGILGCGIWVAVTGGLHLDGLADCCDGLPASVSRERRLEIMKDSRLGTFGGTGLFLVLALKCAVLAELAAARPVFLVLSCCLAGFLARSHVFSVMREPAARPGGMGELLRTGLERCDQGRIRLLVGGVTALFCLFMLIVEPEKLFSGVYAMVACWLATLCLKRLALKRLGGVTGDVFGCIIEVNECVALLILAMA